MEKFPGFGRKNSQTSDLAIAIRSNLAKADAENAFTSGSYVPYSDPQIFTVACKLVALAED
jgi:hypothetical protein